MPLITYRYATFQLDVSLKVTFKLCGWFVNVPSSYNIIPFHIISAKFLAGNF